MLTIGYGMGVGGSFLNCCSPFPITICSSLFSSEIELSNIIEEFTLSNGLFIAGRAGIRPLF